MMGHPPVRLSDDAREALLAYSWPGNVRELRNALERAVILAGEGTIETKNLPAFLQGRPAMVPNSTAADAPATAPVASVGGDTFR